jgi:dihydroneopterin aldolase
MLKIELSNLRFHSFHGIHEEEKKTGGDFTVDAVIFFEPEIIPVKHLHDTIDYTVLYEIIKRRMDKPTKLLETLATEIAQEILSADNKIKEVSVKIKKLNAPIPFFNGEASAEYNLKR